MAFGLRTRRQQQTQSNIITTPKAPKLTIPQDAVPGKTFHAILDGQNVRVRCPCGARPGDSMRVIIPKKPTTSVLSNVVKTDVPNVFFVAIPDNVKEGQDFTVTIEGQRLEIERPEGMNAGTIMKVAIPSASSPTRDERQQQLQASSRSSSSRSMSDSDEEDEQFSPHAGRVNSSRRSSRDSSMVVFATVPEDTVAGQEFTAVLQGVPIKVACPPGAPGGTTIKVNIGPKEIDYGRGWIRSLKFSDMKFRWVRHGNNDETKSAAAFVRNLEILPTLGYNMNIPGGRLSFVPAEEVAVTSLVPKDDDKASPSSSSPDTPKEFVTTWEQTTVVQKRILMQKAAWFRNKLCVPRSEGHARLDIRRGGCLLDDSLDSVMSMSKQDFRKQWTICFIGEDGIDEGGLTRDWFQLATKELFDPSKGLWQSCATNQTRMEINPSSGAFCDIHLMYFRFMGRMMGRALLDNQLVAGRLTPYLYKHVLGFPITLEDLKDVDEVYYNSLMQLEIMTREGMDISMLCQDFTTTQDVLGSKQTIELVEGGRDIPVTNDNVHEYIEACLKHRLFDGIKSQLNELLLGFFDIIPEAIVSIFDFEELELLLCGQSKIDMDDWMSNTEYTGEFEGIGSFHPACEWFWEILKDEFNGKMKARTLRFATATSGVPAQGFSALRSSKGNIRKFTIRGVAPGVLMYPRAHTCFNQIDLPVYESKAELRERLTEALSVGCGTFTMY